MSLWVHIEIEPGKYIPVLDNPLAAASVAALFVTPLSLYCSWESQGSPEENFEPWMRENLEWFSSIAGEMKENLCLIAQTISIPWEYSENQYEKYQADCQAAHPNYPGMSKDEFVHACRRMEQAWTDTTTLRIIIDDLIQALKKVHPPDTWWYEEKLSLKDLELFSRTLSAVAEKGHQKVRFCCL
jgi:hypothetical protein